VIVVDGSVVHEQHLFARRVHRCATRRSAKVLAARLQLKVVGWHSDLPSSEWRFRLPLLLPGERGGVPLNGSCTDERAIGIVCWRGGDGPRSAPSLLVVDASVGLSIAILEERGDVRAARDVVAWYLEPLP
jgi:hypothetical protein